MIFSRIIEPQTIDIHGILVHFKPSLRAKRLILRYNDGFMCSVPKGCSMKKAMEFAHKQTAWMVNVSQKHQIRQQITAVSPIIQPNQSITLYGVEYQLHHTSGRGVSAISDNSIIIYGAQSLFQGRFRRVLYQLAEQIYNERIAHFCAQLGKKPPALVIRDTSSRWGSCRSDGLRILLSPRLLFAPPAVCDYVIAHECAHLIQANHSNKFWHVVEQLDPNYDSHRIWMKRHGQNLMQIQI